MAGAAATAVGPLRTAPWSLASGGDFDANSAGDLVFRSASGVTELVLMNGLTGSTRPLLSEPSWAVVP
jgi:hypothetical protein